jgi:hypothetical protein
MQAILEKLAVESALASESDSAKAWDIEMPSAGGKYWDHARAWLITSLHARPPKTPSESPRSLMFVRSAIVRGDSLIASFLVGSAHAALRGERRFAVWFVTPYGAAVATL